MPRAFSLMDVGQRALPTLAPHLEAAARDAEVVLVPGAALAASATWSVEDWKHLATLGARGVLLDVASGDAAAQDHGLGPGAHAHTLRIATQARAVGLAIWARTTVTRSNARSLRGLADWLVAQQARLWWVGLTRAADPGTAAALFPSLGIATPHVLHAMRRAADAGIEPFLRGFPLCVLGPYAAWALPAEGGQDEHGAAACSACPARQRCDGLSPLHRARFGESELHPVAPPPPRGGDEGRAFREEAALVLTSTKTSAE